jgi:mRNA interferase MazF
VDFGTPLGSEPGKVRPAVIVQSNVFNASPIDTVVVCAITSTEHRANDPGNVELDEGDADLPGASVVNVSQIIAVDKTRLMEWIGALIPFRFVNGIIGACQRYGTHG